MMNNYFKICYKDHLKILCPIVLINKDAPNTHWSAVHCAFLKRFSWNSSIGHIGKQSTCTVPNICTESQPIFHALIYLLREKSASFLKVLRES